MSASLNNVATADAYTTANTIQQFGTVRVNLQVTNAAVYWSWAYPDLGADQWALDEFLTPGKYSFDRATSGARFKSGAAGVPAQVTCTLLTARDIGNA